MLSFLKLGGSLITNKHSWRAPRVEVIERLLREIAEARAADPQLQVVLGHGSGSFGHTEAKRHGTRHGVQSPAQWHGFAEVQYAAGALNHFVREAATKADVPIFNAPPSASAVCQNGAIQTLALEPIRHALAHGLVPLVFGDVAIDTALGGTIVSTEDVFRYLAVQLRPARLLLAGLDAGVLTHWPHGEVIPRLTPHTALSGLTGSAAADVTGGMASKVSEMLALATALPDLEIRIFSGEAPGVVKNVLLGKAEVGTVICR